MTRVEAQRTNGIVRIHFESSKANALSSLQLRRLKECFESVSPDKGDRVVLLSSGGTGAFSAGALFDELKALKTESECSDFFRRFGSVLEAIQACPVFVVGRAQGKVVGGGVGLLAACDYVHATEGASIKLSELDIGIGPYVISPAVKRKIGSAALSALTISRAWHSSDWAITKGLYSEVHKGMEEMDAAIASLLKELSSIPTETIQEVRKLLWSGEKPWGPELDSLSMAVGRLCFNNFGVDASVP